MTQIVDYETFKVPPRWLFLKIETRDGIVGWGEPILEGHADAVQKAVGELMNRYLLGEDAGQIEDHWQTMYRGGFYRGGPILMSAVAGIDQALWDIKGKHAGEPVYELLGGATREKIRLYKRIVADDPERARTLAADAVEEGYTAVKLISSNQTSPIESEADLREICAHVEAVKDAVGRTVDVAVDLHGHVSTTMIPQLLSRLERYDLMFVEEPARPEHLESLGCLSERSIPIAVGERLYTRWEFKSHLEANRVNVVQPDISHAGGITEIRRIADLAETYAAKCILSCSVGPVAYAACSQLGLHLTNVVLQPTLDEQYANTYVENVDELGNDGGYVTPSDSPGLGVDVRETQLREHAGQTSDWRNPIRRHDDGSFAEW